jgi:hypothetical protein
MYGLSRYEWVNHHRGIKNSKNGVARLVSRKKKMRFQDFLFICENLKLNSSILPSILLGTGDTFSFTLHRRQVDILAYTLTFLLSLL